MMNRKGFISLLGMGGIGSILNTRTPLTVKAPELIKPKALQKGDTIGLISPASRLPRESQYDDIIKQIEDLGFKVIVGKHARDQYGYLAGKDRDRAKDLNQMFDNDEVDAIMPFRGGWGCNRILPYIDFEIIKNNPKILVGFSDITTLLLAIYAKTGLITFHGPVGKSEWTDYTKRHFSHMLLEEQTPLTVYTPYDKNIEEFDKLSVINPGEATGRLLGGNLTVLTAMMGSDYLPEWEGSILFLEDVGEDIYRIDRMLTQLKLNGVLNKINGFVFGQCTACKRANSYSLTLQQVFEDHIKPLDIPAFAGAPIGHIDEMTTLPIGMQTKIDAQTGRIKWDKPSVISSS